MSGRGSGGKGDIFKAIDAIVNRSQREATDFHSSNRYNRA
jgi:hypothetical protein